MGDARPPQLPAAEDLGHPLPRRASPQESVTLRHHGLARDASMKASPGSRATVVENSPLQRHSSGESHHTGHSDARNWFDHSNRIATANYDTTSMDVDPPFYQKETDSSNGEAHVPAPPALMLPYPPPDAPKPSRDRPSISHSSSAADFRSVIDDLTIENKRLKEELKRYKQFGRDALKKDKLFEIKVHGLPRRKKRELEDTLRDFAAGLGEGSAESSPRNSSPKHPKRNHMSSLSNSKHASSSSSKSRPVDSAYASMSTAASSAAPNSSSASVKRPGQGRPRSSEKVESYLKDIPDGLYPRHLLMNDKERKKWVVRRLEQLFTGKLRARTVHQSTKSALSSDQPPPVNLAGTGATVSVLPTVPAATTSSGEASREAVMQPADAGKEQRPQDASQSNSNSNGDSTDLGGNRRGNGSGSGDRGGSNPSPPNVMLPDQRPTRPLDLDPDRAQVPSDNMDYMRHLGVVPPEYLQETTFRAQNVSMDADGWVYLNLLSNLAQLHIANVTPDFIRSAVTEKSSKLQLSPDGQKIRWRGGRDGTKFSSDSSGELSKGSSADDTDRSKDGQRKKRRTGEATSKPALQTHTTSGSSAESFHYKPMFVRQPSSSGDSAEDESGSPSYGGGGESHQAPISMSGSGSTQRKRRRNDGAIVYYSGAPFCLDLSGDMGGEVSPTTYMMTSSGQETSSGQGASSDPAQDSEPTNGDKPQFARTLSGSSLPLRPLSDGPNLTRRGVESGSESQPELMADDTDSDGLDSDFCWCDDPATPHIPAYEPLLEACGLGGVTPEDHFRITCLTKRPCNVPGAQWRPQLERPITQGAADSIIARLARMSASSPVPSVQASDGRPPVEVEYLRFKVDSLEPAPLPPPAMFYPPFSSSSDSEDSMDFLGSDEEMDDDEVESSGEIEVISQKANPHLSNTYLDDVELSSNDDEEDEISPERLEDVDVDAVAGRGRNRARRPLLVGGRRSSGGAAVSGGVARPGSSVATAGAEESGYNSSSEESSDE